jgi:primary-amine oxidase
MRRALTPSFRPLGVFFHLNVTSRRPQEWKITGWYQRGLYYNSTKAFRAAILSPGFKKLPPNEDGLWTSTDKRGDPLPLDNLPPPITVSEGQKRFKVNTQDNFVSWMDFDFYVSTNQDQGVSLFNIRYKNKRIVYELALQEALAHYAGSDPQQSETLYFDSFGGMGNAILPLVKGYDCPAHATYMNASFTNAAGPIA